MSKRKYNEKTQTDLNLDRLKRLKEFNEQLKKLSFPSSPISVELVKFVSDALDTYFDDNAKSLDAVFGLTKGSGKGYGREFWKRKALEINTKHEKAGSWKVTTDRLSGDERELRRISEDFENEFFTERLAEEIIRELTDEPSDTPNEEVEDET